MSELVSIDDKIFEFIFQMAFRDATMRKAFPKRPGELDDDYSDRKNRIKNNVLVRKIIRQYLSDIVDGNDNDKDDICYQVIEEICKFAELDGFQYGNAQKLVNMVVKYMFIKSYDEEDKKKYFVNVHCPIDGIILEKLKRDYGIKIDVTAWSSMKSHQYRTIQDEIRKICGDESKWNGRKIMPVEFDYYVHG